MTQPDSIRRSKVYISGEEVAAIRDGDKILHISAQQIRQRIPRHGDPIWVSDQQKIGVDEGGAFIETIF